MERTTDLSQEKQLLFRGMRKQIEGGDEDAGVVCFQGYVKIEAGEVAARRAHRGLEAPEKAAVSVAESVLYWH